MSTIARDFTQAVNDADDTALLVYADWCDENGNEPLAVILRQWVNVQTKIRTSPEHFNPDNAFDKLILDFNKEHAFDDIVQFEQRQGQITGRIGGCYTHLDVTPEYLCKRPNLLSSQPFRSMTLIASRAEKEHLSDVMTNWRIQKLWHIDISYFSGWMTRESNLVDVLTAMKPVSSCKTFRIRGVRDVMFKLSSTLIGKKKLSKGCTLQLGNAKPTIVR